MKDFARIGVICVLLLSTVFGSAEELTHDFNAAYAAGKFNWSNSRTIGTVGQPPEMNYVCAGSATFENSTFIYIHLSAVSSTVTTSVAVDDLTKVRIARTTTDAKNMRFWISTDNSSWTQITDEDLIEYKSYEVTVTMPSKGNYYVKIGRATGTSSAVDIREITYIVSPCHCLRIVSE